MIKQIFLVVSLFGFLSSKTTSEKTREPINFLDEFMNNSNGWVQEEINNPLLIQEIKDGMLYLESNSSELGVASSIDFEFDESKDFEIEAKVKIITDTDLCHVTLDFGVRQSKRGLRSVGGQHVNTTWGSTNYYFGYSDLREYLIAKWNKGKETYYARGYTDNIKMRDFNIIRIKKIGRITRYYINQELVFEQPYKKLFGTGIGFSSSPNSKLWVDYIRITN